MKIKELIELLKGYNQEAGVIISCGNCNHTHSWYDGDVKIADYTDILYPFIEMQILTDSKLGTTYQLKGDNRIHFEQDKIVLPNGKIRIPMKTLEDYLSEFYMEYAIYNYISEQVWVQEFIYDWLDNFNMKEKGLEYDPTTDINELMAESFDSIKERHKYGNWDLILDDNPIYDMQKMVENIYRHVKCRE